MLNIFASLKCSKKYWLNFQKPVNKMPTVKLKIQLTVLFSLLPLSTAQLLENKTFGLAGSKVHVRTL